jgi:hypothetical protein
MQNFPHFAIFQLPSNQFPRDPQSQKANGTIGRGFAASSLAPALLASMFLSLAFPKCLAFAICL